MCYSYSYRIRRTNYNRTFRCTLHTAHTSLIVYSDISIEHVHYGLTICFFFPLIIQYSVIVSFRSIARVFQLLGTTNNTNPQTERKKERKKNHSKALACMRRTALVTKIGRFNENDHLVIDSELSFYLFLSCCLLL